MVEMAMIVQLILSVRFCGDVVVSVIVVVLAGEDSSTILDDEMTESGEHKTMFPHRPRRNSQLRTILVSII